MLLDRLAKTPAKKAAAANGIQGLKGLEAIAGGIDFGVKPNIQPGTGVRNQKGRPQQTQATNTAQAHKPAQVDSAHVHHYNANGKDQNSAGHVRLCHHQGANPHQHQAGK